MQIYPNDSRRCFVRETAEILEQLVLDKLVRNRLLLGRTGVI